MKKKYIIPEIMTMAIAQSLPIATSSLSIVNDPIDNVTGDVKMGGEWDIFDYGDADFED